jgi:inner membrane protein
LDNLCHTLTGAAFAEAGLKNRTRFGSVALMIAANLPDIDVLAFVTDTPSVALRRGWTHGVLAQALLPIVLTGTFVLFDRWRPPRSPGARWISPSAILVLSYVGVLSHVGMDWLNTYGVRLLMPFSGKWFYGDAVFIVDPLLWITLAAGIFFARRVGRIAPAAAALIVAGAYSAAMTGSAMSARQRVADAWIAANGRAPAALMVGPVPINPFRKNVIVDVGEYYERGRFDWLSVQLHRDPERVPKNDRHPAAILAVAQDPDFRALLVWSRFPRYEIVPLAEGTRVTLSDMRFGPGLFNVTTIVAVP